MQENKEYIEFVEKFKPKLTTDDCYTPPKVYDAVKNWAVAEYALEGREIVRPFYPGGDYENYIYPERCVVIDNPPFSILSKIKAFYIANKIEFFLFAPHLTLFNGGPSSGNCVVTNSEIIYENGAVVKTSFVTSMGNDFIRTAPELADAVKQAVKSSKTTNKLPKYKYPDAVVSAARLGKIAGVGFRLTKKECHFTRALESQKEKGKTIFGGGYLISELKAAELKAAELKAAREEVVWELSIEEQRIVGRLGANG